MITDDYSSLKKTYKVIISIEPGLAACFPRLFINKKVNIKIFNFSLAYGKCSKISNTLKLRTPKIIAENNF